MRVCNGFCAHKHISKLLLLCEVVTVCHAVTRWVVLPTKCTRRYGGRSAVCFHTPTVRRADHHNGWERDYVVQVSVTRGQSRHVTEVTSTDLTKSKVMMRVIPFLERVIGADLYKRNWDDISYWLVTTRHGITSSQRMHLRKPLTNHDPVDQSRVTRRRVRV